MSPAEAEIALIKQRLDRIERRARDDRRASAGFTMVAVVFFQMADRIPGIAGWLGSLPGDRLTEARLLLAVIVGGALYGVFDVLANRRDRREERELRESLIFSVPTKQDR